MGPPFFNPDGTTKKTGELTTVEYNACGSPLRGSEEPTKRTHKARICTEFQVMKP
jgi:hypothetical protein